VVGNMFVSMPVVQRRCHGYKGVHAGCSSCAFLQIARIHPTSWCKLISWSKLNQSATSTCQFG
jgi:hypothetical protein